MKRAVLAQMAILVLVGAISCGTTAPTDTPTPTPTHTPPPVVESRPTDTPTPTVLPAGVAATPIPTRPASCEVSGELEVTTRVPWALEAAGLDVYAEGNIPFQVHTEQEPYTVTGGGHISYADSGALEACTYSCTYDIDVTIDGTCVEDAAGGKLHLTVGLDAFLTHLLDCGPGNRQSGEVPGQASFELEFPLQEGATAVGDPGPMQWNFVLHLH